MERGNLLFCGVGGQGILLASELTAHALLATGHDVKKSEIHGMSQRGGLVEAHLRFGPKVYSPVNELGTVNIELAFETLEAVRYLQYLNKASIVIVNTQHILPPDVATGKTTYPDDCLEELTSRGITVVPVNGYQIAREIGNVRTANVVMVGALSQFIGVDADIFSEVINRLLPAKLVDINTEAFLAGRAVTKKHTMPADRR